MKAITLRNLPPELAKRLEREAADSGTSLNKTVIRLLAAALGLPGRGRRERRFDDLDHLAGTWTAEEADAFDRALADQRGIDRELWD